MITLFLDHFDLLMRAVQLAGVLLLTLPLWLAVARVLEAT
jgi:hypothetical protein